MSASTVTDKIELPTPCDLSRTAMTYAMFMGRKNGFGAPLKLVACTEDTNIAKCLTEISSYSVRPVDIDKPHNPDDYKKIPYEIDYTYPVRRWSVVFEKGTVSSQGPTLEGMQGG